MTASHRPTDLELLELRAEGVGEDIGGSRGVTLLCTDMVEASPVGSRVSLVYLIESELVFVSNAVIIRSDEARPPWMRAANPGGWHPVEWDELLDGGLGPWTMAVEGHRIVSICHTPVPLTDRAAECGVWTDPEFRRRGYAAAVTAEWAALLRPSGRHLFYSTNLENLSSQRVAARLQLRLLGYQCGPCEVSEEEESHVHPLSAVRSNIEPASLQTARVRTSR